MSTRFDDFLEEQLKDPEIREEYEALQPEYAAIQAMIDARVRSGMTKKELSEKTSLFLNAALTQSCSLSEISSAKRRAPKTEGLFRTMTAEIQTAPGTSGHAQQLMP